MRSDKARERYYGSLSVDKLCTCSGRHYHDMTVTTSLLKVCWLQLGALPDCCIRRILREGLYVSTSFLNKLESMKLVYHEITTKIVLRTSKCNETSTGNVNCKGIMIGVERNIYPVCYN